MVHSDLPANFMVATAPAWKKLIGIAVVVLIPAGTASAALVVGYEFETVVGGNMVDDFSANNLNGTLVDNATVVNDAIRGNVLSLDGENDWVDAGNSALYDITGDMTAMAWAKYEDKEIVEPNHSWYNLFAKGDPNSWRFQHWPAHNFAAFQWALDPSGVANANASANLLGSWHHVASVKSGNTYQVYIDGNLSASDTQTNAPKTSTVSLLIGANPELGGIPANDDPWREMRGLVDDFGLFDTALSQAEIQDVMNNGLSTIPDPGVERIWQVNASGDWNDESNWSGDVPNFPDAEATFGSIIASPRTVFTETDVTVASVTFDNMNQYVVGGNGSINLEAGMQNPAAATINVLQGSHDFQTRVNLLTDAVVNVASDASLEFNHRLDLGGKTLTKAGLGTLTVNNALLTGSGGTVIGLEGVIAGSGVVAGDFVNMGTTLSPGGSGSDAAGQVPEPASLALTLLGLTGLLWLTKRRGRHVRATVLLLAAGLPWLLHSSASAIPLRIDFGIADPTGGTDPNNPNDVQAGWEDFSVQHAAFDLGGGRDGVNPEEPISRTFGGITVTVEGQIGPAPVIAPGFGPSSRDRLPDMNSLDPLGDMFEDVFNDVSRINVSGLPAGDYQVTTYHHDTSFGASEADIFVDGTQVANVEATHDNPNHPDQSKRIPPFGQATFDITSNGSDVVIDFFEPGTTTADQMSVSGLVIEPPGGTGPTTSEWADDVSGVWNEANWIDPIPPNAPGAKAIFGPMIQSPRTVITEVDVTVGEIEFNNSNQYAIAGNGAVIIDAGTDEAAPESRINVMQGSHDFQTRVMYNPSDPEQLNVIDVASGAELEFNHQLDLNGETVTKSGAGALLVNNNQASSGSGTLAITEGSLGGVGTVRGNVVFSGGILAPGLSPGVQSLAGNDSQGSQVPEPATVVLLGVGLFMGWSAMARGRR